MSRLGRLLRDRRALSGDAADGISDAIAKALDELGSEWVWKGRLSKVKRNGTQICRMNADFLRSSYRAAVCRARIRPERVIGARIGPERVMGARMGPQRGLAT